MNVNEFGDFWRWWSGAHARIERAIVTHEWASLPDEIEAQVNAIHPELAWDLSLGGRAEHAFCLSSNGDPALRRLAERWTRAAPPASATWEFHPSRQPRPELSLNIEGETIDPGTAVARCHIDEGRERLDVEVFHEAFLRVDEGARVRLGFLLLDGALGEDNVERWLGAVTACERPPENARPFAELAARIDQLAAAATRHQYHGVERTGRDGVVIPGILNTGLKWIDHLDFDAHATIAVPLLDGVDPEAEAIEVERGLYCALGEHAAHVGHEVMYGQLAVHFFAAMGGTADRIIQEYIAATPARGIRVRWEPDPTWQTLDRWANT